MQIINNFIQEKLQINSKSNVSNKDEEFYEKTSTNLFTEVQNEINKYGEYHTYSIEDGKKKFKKGFISFNKSEEYFCITGYNNSMDFCDSLGWDGDLFEEYDKLSIGESVTVDSDNGSKEEVIRIW